jgi:hypothetical protein
MVQHRCRHCGKFLGDSFPQLPAQRVYTPTMDGFEHFMREMVGLDVARSNQVRRKER